MSNNSMIWLEEYHENPSVVAMCFSGPELDEEICVGLTRDGVKATIELLTGWLADSDARMEQLFTELSGAADA